MAPGRLAGSGVSSGVRSEKRRGEFKAIELGTGRVATAPAYSMIARNLYDEIQLIVCPFVIGGSTSITPVERSAFWPQGAVPKYRLDQSRVLGDYLYVVYPHTDKEGSHSEQWAPPTMRWSAPACTGLSNK